MSYRKAKMLLEKRKEKEEKVPAEEESSEQQPPVVQNKANIFEMMADGDDSEQEEIDQPEKKKNQQEQVTKPQQNTKSKKNKKKKSKAKGPEQQQLDEEKEFKQALKEVGMEVPNFQEKKEQTRQSSWKDIFAISEKRFDYQKQLRRHFRGWAEDKKQGNDDMPRRQQKMQKHLRKMMKKSILAPGVREYFPLNQKFQVETENNEITFMPTKKYSHYQTQYQAIRNSNDINALFQFSQTHPEHVDSNYSIGQFLRLQGNYRQADALIQRVIYIFEISGGYELGEFIKDDYCPSRVSYDAISTSFFMSLFKLMDILGKKGCFRAALQYNKYLLKLNLQDPTACMLCLDYNAISSKQFQFLLHFQLEFPNYLNFNSNFKVEEKKQEKKQEKIEEKTKFEEKSKEKSKQSSEKAILKSIYFLPNFSYSTALCKFMMSNTLKNENKQLIINETTVEQLLDFRPQHWQQALKLSGYTDFTRQDPQTLIVRAILLYPRLILDIAKVNQFSKKYLNYPGFKDYQAKTFAQIMEHQFWAIAPDSYSYYFLKLEALSDSKGLDKILEIYVERSKILWKSNQVILWLKGAMGFVLNSMERSKFNYQEFLIGLCSQNSVDFEVPFSLRRYENIFKGNFSDRVDRIDLNNIQDNQGVQQQPHGNPINIGGNPLSLFLNSLLPWVNLPGVNQQHDPDMPFIDDDQDFV